MYYRGERKGCLRGRGEGEWDKRGGAKTRWQGDGQRKMENRDAVKRDPRKGGRWDAVSGQ